MNPKRVTDANVIPCCGITCKFNNAYAFAKINPRIVCNCSGTAQTDLTVTGCIARPTVTDYSNTTK